MGVKFLVWFSAYSGCIPDISDIPSSIQLCFTAEGQAIGMSSILKKKTIIPSWSGYIQSLGIFHYFPLIYPEQNYSDNDSNI